MIKGEVVPPSLFPPTHCSVCHTLVIVFFIYHHILPLHIFELIVTMDEGGTCNRATNVAGMHDPNVLLIKAFGLIRFQKKYSPPFFLMKSHLVPGAGKQFLKKNIFGRMSPEYPVPEKPETQQNFPLSIGKLVNPTSLIQHSKPQGNFGRMSPIEDLKEPN